MWVSQILLRHSCGEEFLTSCGDLVSAEMSRIVSVTSGVTLVELSVTQFQCFTTLQEPADLDPEERNVRPRTESTAVLKYFESTLVLLKLLVVMVNQSTSV